MEVDAHVTDADQLAELLLKHLRQELDPEEQKKLNKWIAEHPTHKQIYDRINSEEQLLNDLQLLKQVNLDAWWQKISRQAPPAIHAPALFKRPVFFIFLLMLLALVAFIIW
jgi:ferric-dicitrate binding protein FerR (iron transport regulator)